MNNQTKAAKTRKQPYRKRGPRKPKVKTQDEYINPLDFWEMSHDQTVGEEAMAGEKNESRKKALFIVGTDTGVGKTIAICALGTLLEQRQVKAAAVKPVQCSGEDNHIFDQAFGTGNSDETEGLYIFKGKSEPYFAIKQNKAGFDKNQVLKLCRQVSEQHDVTFIEAPGGLMDPLTEKYNIGDLIRDMKTEAVIIAPLKTGVLNHLAMTISHAKTSGVTIRGVLFTAGDKSITKDYFLANVQAVRDMMKTPVIGIVPFLEKGSREEIIEKCGKKISFKVLLDFPVEAVKEEVSSKTPETNPDKSPEINNKTASKSKRRPSRGRRRIRRVEKQTG